MSFQVSLCPNNDIITPFGQGVLYLEALPFAPSKQDQPHFMDAREAATMKQQGKGLRIEELDSRLWTEAVDSHSLSALL